MNRRPLLLATSALALAFFASPLMADGNLACSDITQARYLLEKYAVNDPSAYCVRASTLADANPSLREEIKREAKRVGKRYDISYPDCPAAAVAGTVQPQAYAYANPPVATGYYQPIQQPPVIYQQPAPLGYYAAPPAPVATTGTTVPVATTGTTVPVAATGGDITTTDAIVGEGARITGSNAGFLVGSDLVWAGIGLLAAGGTAAALISTGTVGGSSTPITTGCNNAEFNASGNLGQINAQAACTTGFTAKGIPVAVLDTGVDTTHNEFQGRIVNPYDFETNQAGQATASQLNAHGTEVAGVLAAARNGVGVEGVAYEANIEPLRVFDQSGTGLASFVPAINYAVSSGATIINGSYGPDDNAHRAMEAAGYQIIPSADQGEAAAYLAAANAGVILVFPAGNSFQIAPTIALNPTGPGFFPFIRPANAAITGAAAGAYRNPDGSQITSDFSALQPLTIVVVGVDSSNHISSFSNRCGVAAAWCIAAPDENILTTAPGNTYTTVSGTSFAAPQVSGAAAILKQEFPNLTSQQIVALLLSTATNIGDSSIYGHGLLNLDAATRPIGTAGIATTGTVSGQRTTLAETSITYGAAFGENATSALGGKQVEFLDGLDRSYLAALNSLVHTNVQSFDSQLAMDRYNHPEQRQELNIGDKIAMGFILSGGSNGSDDTTISNAVTDRLTGSSPKDVNDQTSISKFSVTNHFSDTTQASVHYRDADSLTLGFSDDDRTRLSHTLDKDGLTNPYANFTNDGYASTIKMDALGGTVRVSGFFGHSDVDPDAKNYGSQAETTYKVADHSSAYFALGSLFEDNRVLGSKGTGAFQFGNGTMTVYSGLGGKMTLDDQTVVRATGYAGYTNPNTASNSLITGASGIITTSFNADVERKGTFSKNDSLSFGVAQPLRVESGSLKFNLPYTRSYTTDAVLSNSFNQDLSADGREVDMQVNYSFTLDGASTVSAGGLYRVDAGHRSGASDALGVLRWSSAF